MGHIIQSINQCHHSHHFNHHHPATAAVGLRPSSVALRPSRSCHRHCHHSCCHQSSLMSSLFQATSKCLYANLNHCIEGKIACFSCFPKMLHQLCSIHTLSLLPSTQRRCQTKSLYLWQSLRKTKGSIEQSPDYNFH